MRRALAIPLFAVFIITAVTLLPASDADPGDPSNMMLIDMGNGEYHWGGTPSGASLLDATVECATEFGLGVNHSSGAITSIGDIHNMELRGETVLKTNWKLYVWGGRSWECVGTYDLDAPAPSDVVAWGFYPDDDHFDIVKPVPTPLMKTAWVRFKGSSASRSVSDSYGPSNPKEPMEWTRSYSTGFVNSAILVAGDRLFHTTGGVYGGAGTNADPWLYCIDRFTGEEIWNYHYAKGDGFEITSQLVVGDMVLLSCSNKQFVCLDIKNGRPLWSFDVPFDPPVDAEGNYLFKFPVIGMSGTTPVYDSGAMVFGSADGTVWCYKVNRDSPELIWKVVPPIECRGSFYFHGPTLMTLDIEGIRERVVFIGHYDGHILSMRLSDGSPIWKDDDGNPVYGKKLVDFTPEQGVPGSVGSIVVSHDGLLYVTCSDGKMTTKRGYMCFIDPSTGERAKEDLGILASSPVALPDGFISYVSPAYGGAETLIRQDGSRTEVKDAICKFDLEGRLLWSSASYGWIKAPLTYADGVVYGMDYSAGFYYPHGGCLTAVSADDGSELWRILLRPYSIDSYSMVQPTVVDGKLYLGNDLGAIYCLSDVQGEMVPETEVEKMDTAGFRHWSWLAILASVVIGTIIFARLY